MRVAQLPTHLRHANEGALAISELGHAEPDGQLASDALHHAHRAVVAKMLLDRGGEYGDDTHALSHRQRGEDAGFADPDHRLFRDLAQHVQPGIAVARDDEGTGTRFERGDLPHERRNSCLDVLLGLNARGTVRQRMTLDALPVGEAKRLQSFVNPARHRLKRVRVKDVDRLAHHRVILSPMHGPLATRWRHRAQRSRTAHRLWYVVILPT